MTTHATKHATQPMLPIMRVLGWEFLRCIRVSGVLYLLAALVLPWILFRVILDTRLEHFKPENYYPAFYGLTIFLGIVFAYEAQKGVRQFLSTRPLTTEFMFSWLLCIPIAGVATTFILANGAVQALYGVRWPWVRPLLWLVFFVVFAKCSYWRVMVGHAWEILLAIAIGAFAVFCFAWVQGHDEILLDSPFTAAEVTLLGAATVVALIVGYRSFVAIRTTCGDKGSEAWFAERYGKVDVALVEMVSKAEADPTSQSPLVPLASSNDGLDWIAWRQCGVPALSICGMMTFLGIAMQIAVVVDYSELPILFLRPRELFEITVVMFVMSCFAAGVGIGMLMATMIRTPGKPRQMHMSTFFAARPVANTELWRVLGRAMFRYSVFAWLLLAALLSIFPVLVLSSSESSGQFIYGFQEKNLFYSSLGPFSVAAWLLFGFLVIWTSAGVTASGMFSGNDRVATVIFATVVCLLVTICFVGLALPNHTGLIATASWTIFGVAALSVTVWAFRSAIRHKFITVRHVVGSVFVWSLLATFAVNFVASQHVLGSVLLSSLAAFGVAAGPLGLTASRHR